MSPGFHRITVQAYDAQGTFKTTRYAEVCALDPALPSVTLCVPTHGAVARSHLRVLARARSTGQVQLVQIYVDGAKVHEVSSDRVDHGLTLPPGLHRLVVQARDDLNNLFTSAVYVTVE